jgi:hypothetical protein
VTRKLSVSLRRFVRLTVGTEQEKLIEVLKQL